MPASSLVGRLVRAFLLASLPILGLGALAAYLSATATLRESVFERLSAVSTVKASALDTWVDNLASEVALLSELPSLRELASDLADEAPEGTRAAAGERLSELFELALDKRPSFREVFFLAPVGGRILVSTDERNQGQYRIYDRYFVEGKRAAFVQNVYPSPVTLEPTLTLSAPVQCERGELLGVLAAHLSLDYLDRNILQRTGLGDSGAVTLVDQYKVVVTGRRYGKTVAGAGASSRAIDQVVLGLGGAGLYRDLAGAEVIGVYRWLEDRELGLIVEIGQDEAFASARRLALSILLAGSGLVVLLVAGIYVAARRIARPIQALTRAAAGVRDGDLSLRAPAPADDEIGDLARTFNRMIEQLASEAEDRRQAAEMRESLIAELEQKNDELERFAYTISHDLKAPLVTIRGFLGFLKRDAAVAASDPSAVQRLDRDVARIEAAAGKMTRLLDELLEMSRIGRTAAPFEEVAFGAVAREAEELVAGAILERGVEVEVASDLPDVRGDRARLVELVQNLLDNAARYMGEQPSPRIDAGVRHGDPPVFFVRDNGIGIEPKYHDKIFGLFERLDPRATEGTGIGLALVKRIVEVHGGEIWVESEGAGRGSTFCFTLPQGRDRDVGEPR